MNLATLTIAELATLIVDDLATLEVGVNSGSLAYLSTSPSACLSPSQLNPLFFQKG